MVGGGGGRGGGGGGMASVLLVTLFESKAVNSEVFEFSAPLPRRPR